MTKIIISLFILGIILSGCYFIFYSKEDYYDLTVEYIGDGIEAKEIIILENETEIYSLTIKEFNDVTQLIWDNYNPKPKIGGRDVQPGAFGFFDRTAKISPDNKKLIISVHDYAVASTISFIAVADIEAKKIDFAKNPIQGSVDDFYWSSDSKSVAYSLSTARDFGDFLAVYDLEKKENNFILNGEIILNGVRYFDYLEEKEINNKIREYTPNFKVLKWENDYLKFSTSDPENIFTRLNWTIEKEGNNLLFVE